MIYLDATTKDFHGDILPFSSLIENRKSVGILR